MRIMKKASLGFLSPVLILLLILVGSVVAFQIPRQLPNPSLSCGSGTSNRYVQKGTASFASTNGQLWAKKKKGNVKKLVKEAETDDSEDEDFDFSFNPNLEGMEEMTKAQKQEDQDGAISPSMKDKLLAESQTPFRTVRIFIYGAFAFGALIGGLTAISQTLGALNGNENGPDLQQSLINVFVDFAVVAAAAFGYVTESNTQRQKEALVAEQRTANKGAGPISAAVAAERLAELNELQAAIQNENDEGKFPVLKIKSLNTGADQHIVVIAAEESVLEEALLKARIVKDEFDIIPTLVVPVKLAKDSLGEAKGFAMRKGYMTQGFVAPPYPLEDWQAFMEREVSDAVRQGVEDARKQGVVLVLRKDGVVIRRGVGVPIWKQLVEELAGGDKR